MTEIHFTGGQGAIWIQPKGPATDMVYLGCHEIASVEEPLGDYTPFFCPDPSKPKTWVTSGETFAPPEAVTAQIMEDITASLSYLETQKCPFPLYINMVCSGRKDVFANYEKTYLVDVRRITNRSYENLALRDTDERASVTHDVSGAPPLIKIIEVESLEQTLPDATGGGG